MEKILIISAISYIEQFISTSTVRWVTVYPRLIYLFVTRQVSQESTFLFQFSLGSSHDLQPLFHSLSLLCGPNCLRPNLLCLVVATPLSQHICHCWQKVCRLSICNHSKFSMHIGIIIWCLRRDDLSNEVPRVLVVKPDAWFRMGDLLSVTWGLSGWLSVVLGPFLMFALRENVLLNEIQAKSLHWAPTWTQRQFLYHGTCLYCPSNLSAHHCIGSHSLLCESAQWIQC